MITCVAMNIKPMAKAFSEMSFCYLQRVRNPLQVLLTHCMQWLVGRNKFKVSNTLSCLTHFNLSLNISGCCATLMIQGTQESRNTKTLRQSMERGKTNFDAHKKINCDPTKLWMLKKEQLHKANILCYRATHWKSRWKLFILQFC